MREDSLDAGCSGAPTVARFLGLVSNADNDNCFIRVKPLTAKAASANYPLSTFISFNWFLAQAYSMSVLQTLQYLEAWAYNFTS